jgi:DNA-binding NarL/FixJ family response regulator
MNGTIVVSRAVNLHGLIEKHLEVLGFNNVTVTAAEKDGLDLLIREQMPKLLMMDAGFYQSATPYMVRELLEEHEGLNIAIVSVDYCATSLAAWFIWYGALSYARMWDGCEKFVMSLRIIREGNEYVSPPVKNLIDNSEWPDTKCRETQRLMACLIMLCSGFTPEMIGEVLRISRNTVHSHLASLYKNYHAKTGKKWSPWHGRSALSQKTTSGSSAVKPIMRHYPSGWKPEKKPDTNILRFHMPKREPVMKTKGAV